MLHSSSVSLTKWMFSYSCYIPTQLTNHKWRKKTLTDDSYLLIGVLCYLLNIQLRRGEWISCRKRWFRKQFQQNQRIIIDNRCRWTDRKCTTAPRIVSVSVRQRLWTVAKISRFQKLVADQRTVSIPHFTASHHITLLDIIDRQQTISCDYYCMGLFGM